DRGRALKAEGRPGARQVRLLERKTAGILAAGAAHPEARPKGPGVARPHLEVDDAVVIARRADLHVVDRAVRAHQALGLFNQTQRYAVAGLEEQRAADQPRARLDVQRVRGAVEETAFVRIVEIEDVV